MQIIKGKDSIAKLCFYIGIAIQAIVMVIGYSVWDVPYAGRCLQAAFAFPLEKEMAIRSSTIAWKIPWTEEPGRLQYIGSQRVGHD